LKGLLLSLCGNDRHLGGAVIDPPPLSLSLSLFTAHAHAHMHTHTHAHTHTHTHTHPHHTHTHTQHLKAVVVDPPPLALLSLSTHTCTHAHVRTSQAKVRQMKEQQQRWLKDRQASLSTSTGVASGSGASSRTVHVRRGGDTAAAAPAAALNGDEAAWLANRGREAEAPLGANAAPHGGTVCSHLNWLLGEGGGLLEHGGARLSSAPPMIQLYVRSNILPLSASLASDSCRG
jgi:hypothetical protein